MSNKLHARFWKYDGNHSNGRDCERYDPHQLGLPLISGLAHLVDSGEYSVNGVSLDGVVVRHHKAEDRFGHQVHVTATREQWDAAKKYLARLFPGYY